MVLIELEMLVLAYAFPPKGAQSVVSTAHLSARFEEVVVAGALSAEQLEHVAQRALALEPRAHAIRSVSALAYRRACEAYERLIEAGEPTPLAANAHDPFVRLCNCLLRLSERLGDADACQDADLRHKFGSMLALAEKRPASRPQTWAALLEWAVQKADRWATRAARSGNHVSAEGWMSRAINMQTALLACVDAGRRGVEEQLLARGLQPKYDKLLSQRAASVQPEDPAGLTSLLKRKHMLDAVCT
jgi:hypothetical protein